MVNKMRKPFRKRGRNNLLMKCVALTFFISWNCFSQENNVRYPYSLDFRSKTQPVGIIKPLPNRNSAKFYTDGLLLTDNRNQFGAILLDNTSFSSENGIEIDFEYAMYDGTTHLGNYGDGLSVFLYDADAEESIGATGAGLGYSFRRAIKSSEKSPGLVGAYLGIGLDQYGNFKLSRFEDSERINGMPLNFRKHVTSHVTLRGAEHPIGLNGVRGKGYSGYPVLISRSTRYGTDATGAKLSTTNNGEYRLLESLPPELAFDLRSGSLSKEVGDSAYRKVFITLMPHADGGFNITVRIKHGQNLTTVIDKYHYKTSIVYLENANSYSNGETGSKGANTLHELNATVPKKIKIGFAASTGGASQKHLVRDLVLKLPYMAELEGDFATICGNYHNSFYLKVFENDKVYNGSLTSVEKPQAGSTADFIDFSSLLFENGAGENLGTTHTIPGKGVWSYKADTGEVGFTPEKHFVGEVSTFYSVKGLNTNHGPFGQEDYRSEPCKVTLKVIRCNAISNPRQVVSNSN